MLMPLKKINSMLNGEDGGIMRHMRLDTQGHDCLVSGLKKSKYAPQVYS
jgi:hypothetical protein